MTRLIPFILLVLLATCCWLCVAPKPTQPPRRSYTDMMRTQELEHSTWPDQTPEWFGHKSCSRCSGGHTHSLSVEPGRSKVVKLPPKVGEPTTWVEVTALGDTRRYYVPGGPV
jgi:hypothetical protein